ncbi:hypothetical protein HK097_007870 [Rhizophlyctis rosea]|uniref:Uncharacterized protein n=1 Tax=Rhizophlyctis rosea TaxID=64517 RepID=A0AAD5SCL1_9FUNG|nr:hypothetical protein HK097_007870 [Rhizophlyctis rosea]
MTESEKQMGTILIWAATKGHHSIVHLALPKSHLIHKNLAMQVACRKGDLRLLEMVLDAGADAHMQTGWKRKMDMFWTWPSEHDLAPYPYSLPEAAQHGHLTLVQLLLQRNASGSTLPHGALNPIMTRIREITKAGEEGGEGVPLQHWIDIMKLLVALDTCPEPLKEVALAQSATLPSTDLLQYCLDKGVDPNCYHTAKNALSMAVEASNIHSVRLLLKANINMQTKGHGALLSAVNAVAKPPKELTGPALAEYQCRYEEIVRLLLEFGANPSALENEALQIASEAGSLTIVHLLLKAGVNPGLWDGKPLICASGKGHVEVVRLLLENGADVADKRAKALMDAVRGNHLEVVRTLLDAKVYGSSMREDIASQGLPIAAANGSAEMVKWHLDHGAMKDDKGGRIPTPELLEFGTAEYQKGIDRQNALRERRRLLRNALCNGAGKGFTGVVDVLLREGVAECLHKWQLNEAIETAKKNCHNEIVGRLTEIRSRIWG